VYKSKQASNNSGPTTAGEFSWHELCTTDAAAAVNFYSKLAGWGVGPKHDMGSEFGTYHLMLQNGNQYVGIFQSTTMPPGWTCYVKVDDVGKAANAAKAAGGRIINGPMEVPGGSWIAQILDPAGVMFAVHEEKVAAASEPAPAKAAPKPKAQKPAAAKPAEAPAAAEPAKPAAAKPAAPKPAAAEPAKPSASKPAAPAPAAAAAPAAKKPPAKKAAVKSKAPAKAAAKKAPARKAAKKAAKKTATKAGKKAAKKVARKAAGKKAAKKAPMKKKAAKKAKKRR
jgi:predicted enzyme related to lactoylglutathione lyase